MTTFMSCSTSSTDIPWDRTFRMSCAISSDSVMFSPATGSSSNRSLGCAAKALAISKRFCRPKGKLYAGQSALSSRLKKARTSQVLCLISFLLVQIPANDTSSSETRCESLHAGRP